MYLTLESLKTIAKFAGLILLVVGLQPPNIIYYFIQKPNLTSSLAHLAITFLSFLFFTIPLPLKKINNKENNILLLCLPDSFGIKLFSFLKLYSKFTFVKNAVVILATQLAILIQ